jgi:inosine-uridine nucleoside N-ribohydrolase
VNKLDKVNDVGKLLKKMYSMYWEPNFPDKRVATNDSCAYFSLVYPKLFTFERVSVTVNTTDAPGKTLVDFDGVGNVLLVTDVDRENFIKLLDSDLLKYDNLSIPTV